jgi:type VI protein secretion system component VasK
MPLLDIIWSIFMFFLLVAWIWVIIGVIGDVFRSKDLNGLAKGIWVLLIIVIPWLGVLAYLIIRGQGMEERNLAALSAAEEMRRSYIQSVSAPSAADELQKLAELKEKGVISDSEFEAQKAKLLA